MSDVTQENAEQGGTALRWESQPRGGREKLAEDTLMTQAEEVQVWVMPDDGNSLFSAAAHQMNWVSASLRKAASVMRMVAAFHLILDTDQYREAILKSVQEHGERFANQPDDNAKVTEYLKHVILHSFPIGEEGLQALADGLGVDIMLLPLHGPSSIVRSRRQPAHKQIWIAQQPLRDQRGVAYRHFDSVKRVSAFIS